MDSLWAPWRMSYINKIDKKEPECIFCSKPLQGDDRENLLLFRGQFCFVIMNLYPYNNGHLLIVPNKHTAELSDIDPQIAGELWALVIKGRDALFSAMKPDGFNIGMNLGRTAGAGIDSHLHMHIVPRWNGDTNFLPVIGETKVISQSVYDTFDLLKPHFK
jgi:ATP adenylyltransferase